MECYLICVSVSMMYDIFTAMRFVCIFGTFVVLGWFKLCSDVPGSSSVSVLTFDKEEEDRWFWLMHTRG